MPLFNSFHAYSIGLCILNSEHRKLFSYVDWPFGCLAKTFLLAVSKIGNCRFFPSTGENINIPYPQAQLIMPFYGLFFVKNLNGNSCVTLNFQNIRAPVFSSIMYGIF
jgi:hypothetical protein